jgi:hypothetical protein
MPTDKLLLPTRPHQLMPSTHCDHPIDPSRCPLRTPRHLPWRRRYQLHFPDPPRHLRNHLSKQRHKLRAGHLWNPHLLRVRGLFGSYCLLHYRRDELRETESALNGCRQRCILHSRDSDDLPRQSDVESYRLEPGWQVWIHLGRHCGSVLRQCLLRPART